MYNCTLGLAREGTLLLCFDMAKRPLDSDMPLLYSGPTITAEPIQADGVRGMPTTVHDVCGVLPCIFAFDRAVVRVSHTPSTSSLQLLEVGRESSPSRRGDHVVGHAANG